MKIQLSLMLALGCVGAFASSATNYDILGRKGSKMNSPMVYKNVDYTKAKKNEQRKIGSSLESRALHRTGMTDDVAAIEGIFTSGSTTPFTGYNNGQSIPNANYYFKRYKSQSSDDCSNGKCYFDWNRYKAKSDENFIPINMYGGLNDPSHSSHTSYPGYMYSSQESTTHAVHYGWTNYPYSFEMDFPSNDYQRISPYGGGSNIKYTDFETVKNNFFLSKAETVPNWYDNKATDVGIYMGVDALPVQLGCWRFVGYIKANNESFSRNDVHEMLSSRSYSLVQEASRGHSVPFVGRLLEYGNPAEKIPQIYIGVRNNGVSKGVTHTSNGDEARYTLVAQALDNFIYEYRTIEFVPAGNYGVDGTNMQGYLNAKGQAANAITVGALGVSVSPLNSLVGEITDYTSTKSYNGSSLKPEIYNYSNIKMNKYRTSEDMYDLAKRYGNTWYQPLYDGTEIAAAYTAGIVSNLLSINPFYRWHPEVVKALLLTEPKEAPEYRYLIFGDQVDIDGYDYESRYWNGDINKLKSRTANNRHEIWFAVKNYESSTVNAAISWLSSGNDISKAGKVPQDFDLYAYGCNSTLCANKAEGEDRHMSASDVSALINQGIERNLLASSLSSNNSFEKVSFSTNNYDYTVFRIILYKDKSVENKDQIVLGFNYVTYLTVYYR